MARKFSFSVFAFSMLIFPALLPCAAESLPSLRNNINNDGVYTYAQVYINVIEGAVYQPIDQGTYNEGADDISSLIFPSVSGSVTGIGGARAECEAMANIGAETGQSDYGPQAGGQLYMMNSNAWADPADTSLVVSTASIQLAQAFAKAQYTIQENPDNPDVGHGFQSAGLTSYIYFNIYGNFGFGGGSVTMYGHVASSELTLNTWDQANQVFEITGSVSGSSVDDVYYGGVNHLYVGYQLTQIGAQMWTEADVQVQESVQADNDGQSAPSAAEPDGRDYGLIVWYSVNTL
jgi:hypothetical protein